MNNRLSKLTLAILSASTMGAAFPSLAQETPESEASDAVEVIEVRASPAVLLSLRDSSASTHVLSMPLWQKI